MGLARPVTTEFPVDLDDQAIVTAIQDGRVARLAADTLAVGPTDRAQRIAETCSRIAAQIGAERQRLAPLITASGADVDLGEAPAAAQRHELRIDVSADDAPTVAGVLEQNGYLRYPRWRRGAERSFWATSGEVVLTRPGDWTSVVRIRWSPPGRPTTLRRLVRPTAADWDIIELPSPVWRAYSVVRPIRLALERLALRDDDHSGLEPFLSTPTSLIVPLLEYAGVDEHDTLADIGCGDGRLLIEGARRFGCRSFGIEHNLDRVGDARAAASAAGLEHTVRIEQGDGLEADLSDITVAVVFLPVGVAARVVPDLLTRLRPGARIVAHEQSPLLPGMPAPVRSAPIVGRDALTVAHLWNVAASTAGPGAVVVGESLDTSKQPSTDP
jgi:SAM-dependent methyltransferase